MMRRGDGAWRAARALVAASSVKLNTAIEQETLRNLLLAHEHTVTAFCSTAAFGPSRQMEPLPVAQQWHQKAAYCASALSYAEMLRRVGLLQTEVADGANPATHSFIPIYKTPAERETFVQHLQADAAWNTFLTEMAKLTQPVSTTLYRTVQSWGDRADTDHVWMGYAFHVTDPAAFLAAINKLMASPTGKKFPGQVYLSAVQAGGITPVTHLISVGFASEAEMEAWNTMRDASADWAAYLKESRKAAEFLGANLSRDLKTWGPASLSSLAGK